MGIKWVVGNGEKVRFWEDQWLGNTSLAILFWPLYIINEQQGKSISEVWDGEELRLSFRRSVSVRLMSLWEELKATVESIVLNDEEDQILWTYSSTRKYSVQSLYAIINHRGVVLVFIQSVWKLNIPPRVQFFLWLISNNKVLTRDNLAKKREVNDPTCLFCDEKESIIHLFFHCCVAKMSGSISHYGLIDLLVLIMNLLLPCGLLTKNLGCVILFRQQSFGCSGNYEILFAFRVYRGMG
jgi:hypothetical protein